MVIELYLMKRKERKKERKKEDEQNGNFHVCFSQLSYELAELLGYFLQWNSKGFLSVNLSTHFAVVMTKLLPYLKYRRPF